MVEVFVVDRAAFFGGDWPHGFVPLAAADGASFLDRARALGRFVDRPTAERTPAWKQWIPYCVIRCAARGSPPNPVPEGLFRVQRTHGQSEARLHGLWSIGLGGHVEPEDAVPSPGRTETAGQFFARSLWRELKEELHFELSGTSEPHFLGLLNDDSTAVGQVHAGLVYRLDLEVDLARAAESVRVREISKMRGGFGSLVEFRDLWQDPSRFESWSQFLVQAGVAGPIGASV
jgi:predicted NUDIX family phosphoesterase